MTDYQKLQKLYDEIDDLANEKAIFKTFDDINAWKIKTEIFIQKKFGKGSSIDQQFQEIFKNCFLPVSLPHVKSAYEKALSIIRIYLDYMKDDLDEIHTNLLQNIATKTNTDFSNIFIVHGHDGEMRESVARLIERQGIHPIILSDEVNTGRTIIEKIEKYDSVGAAICIFSPDDVGKSKKENVERNRARQNVVLETGYFMGKLGRDRVIILSNGDLEFPSDLQGIVYTGAEWKFKLLKELREMGYSIDLNKL